MADDIEELNIRDLSGQIRAEINMAANFGDLHEELKVGGLSGKIDTDAIKRMTKNELAGYSEAMDLAMHVMVRHCGKKLVNCNEMPVDALPDKQIERFGEDVDEE